MERTKTIRFASELPIYVKGFEIAIELAMQALDDLDHERESRLNHDMAPRDGYVKPRYDTGWKVHADAVDWFRWQLTYDIKHRDAYISLGRNAQFPMQTDAEKCVAHIRERLKMGVEEGKIDVVAAELLSAHLFTWHYDASRDWQVQNFYHVWLGRVTAAFARHWSCYDKASKLTPHSLPSEYKNLGVFKWVPSIRPRRRKAVQS